jgi:hypothetical protein
MTEVFTYIFHVREVTERSLALRTWKDSNGQVQSENQSLGWFVTLDPGGLTLSCSRWPNGVPSRPPDAFHPGARVKLTLEVLP